MNFPGITVLAEIFPHTTPTSQYLVRNISDGQYRIMDLTSLIPVPSINPAGMSDDMVSSYIRAGISFPPISQALGTFDNLAQLRNLPRISYEQAINLPVITPQSLSKQFVYIRVQIC